MMRDPAFSLLARPAPRTLRGMRVLVLGLGDTGLSMARWVEREGGIPRVADTRAAPPRKPEYCGELRSGPFAPELLEDVQMLAVSPGLALDQPLITEALHKDIPIVGDVELFAWQNCSKVLAITGTNGKTTVTALTGHLLRAAGIDAEVAGNISPAVLDASMKRASPPAAWVLELSSYQLETTWSLAPQAAAVLNVSEDHLDRYGSLDDYAAAKARILEGAKLQIVNRDDARTLAMTRAGSSVVTFGLDAPPSERDYGVRDGQLVRGSRVIIDAAALPIHGWHNAANALAACALASAMDVPLEDLKAGLRSFRGLPHRLELVATRRGVEWYDDSKGTNVGATIAALKGLGRPTVLILGGDGKGQDFSPLRPVVAQFATTTLLIGRDAPLIEKALSGLRILRCPSLESAVEEAAASAKPGTAVLLSPACASFDMFRDYKHRGEAFAAAVRGLPA
jgi:UDP-N-acetylmuramoylalanine--D-glutamate ligase